MGDKVRVLRILEYIGSRKAIENTLDGGTVPAYGKHDFPGLIVKSGIVGSNPEILNDKDNIQLRELIAAGDMLLDALGIYKIWAMQIDRWNKAKEAVIRMNPELDDRILSFPIEGENGCVSIPR